MGKPTFCAGKPAGTGLALEEADTPDSPTDTVLKGYFNDTEKLVLTFCQQQFSPWYWQTAPLHLVSLVTKGRDL